MSAYPRKRTCAVQLGCLLWATSGHATRLLTIAAAAMPKKPEHIGQHMTRSLSNRAKDSEYCGYTGNQKQTIGQHSVATRRVPRYEPNYSGNGYPEIEARIVADPVDKTTREGLNRAGAIRQSCERTRTEA